MQSFNNWLDEKLLLEFRKIKMSERMQVQWHDLEQQIGKMFDDFQWGPYEKSLTDDMTQDVQKQMYKIEDQLFDELEAHKEKILKLKDNIEEAKWQLRDEEGESSGQVLYLMYQEIMHRKQKLIGYVNDLSTKFPKRIDALRTALEKRVQSVRPMPREISKPIEDMWKYPGGRQRRETKPWETS